MRTGMSRVALMAALVVMGWAMMAGGAARAEDGGEGVVNINTATQEQLQLLNGIGPAKAKTIIEYRTQHPFKTVDELDKIKGIGKGLLEKVRKNVTLDGQTTMKARPKKARAKR